MSNIFKQVNSRFAVQSEDYEEGKSIKKERECSFEKKDRNERNEYRNNRYDNSNRNRNNFTIKDEAQIKQALEKEKEKKKTQALHPDNFPVLGQKKENELCDEKKVDINGILPLFADKLKHVKNKNNMEYIHEIEEDIVQPGYVLIKKDKKTNKVIMKYGKCEEDRKNREPDPMDVYYALVELYEKRKEEYIDMWGYDDYEKEFLFPNYDYDYFDKLDEKYEAEMEEEMEKEIARAKVIEDEL
jgi:hypothetical protein